MSFYKCTHNHYILPIKLSPFPTLTNHQLDGQTDSTHHSYRQYTAW